MAGELDPGQWAREQASRLVAFGAAEHPDDSDLLERRREIQARLAARLAAEPRSALGHWSALPTGLAQTQQHSPYSESLHVELAGIDAELERRRAARRGAA